MNDLWKQSTGPLPRRLIDSLATVFLTSVWVNQGIKTLYFTNNSGVYLKTPFSHNITPGVLSLDNSRLSQYTQCSIFFLNLITNLIKCIFPNLKFFVSDLNIVATFHRTMENINDQSNAFATNAQSLPNLALIAVPN